MLFQGPFGNDINSTLDGIDIWVNLTSQESKSLPDEFRNTPASIGGGYSKTLYESLGTDTTLRAPFTCGENWTTSSVGAIFYSPQLSSPNASNFQFVIKDYNMGSGDSPGNFTGDLLNLHDNSAYFNSTKPPSLYSRLQVNIHYSYYNQLKLRTGSGFQLDYPVRYCRI